MSISNPDTKYYSLITQIISNVAKCHSCPMKFSYLSCCDAYKFVRLSLNFVIVCSGYTLDREDRVSGRSSFR
jgi:hypothetical protein